MLRAILRILPLLTLFFATTAYGKPEYARREQKACEFCHVSQSPNSIDPISKMRNPTTRNNRGMYYESHNHTFDGFKVEVAKRKTLNFKFRWSQEFSDLPNRMAIADVKGGGKPSLITLHETKDGKGSLLKVQRWNGDAFISEFEEASNSAPDKMQVGKFAGAQKPAMIVTENRMWSWNGKKFVSKALGKARLLVGIARFKTGEDKVLLLEGMELRAYKVNPQLEEWLVEPSPAPTASKEVTLLALHGSNQTLTQLGLNEIIADGGVLGFWTPQEVNQPLLYQVKVDRDADLDPSSKDIKNPRLIVRRETFFVMVTDTRGLDLWMSPRLEMRPLDLLMESPQGDGKLGALILLKEPAKDKPRRLGFFEFIPENP